VNFKFQLPIMFVFLVFHKSGLIKNRSFSEDLSADKDHLCGLVVSVEDYKHRGPGFDSRALLRIFLRELGLERGPQPRDRIN
jgi:hypothetical protein